MPSIAIEQSYEAVYIVDADLGDEQIGVITAKYRGVVEGGGGVVEKVDQWERRRLAYEIKGRTEGIYLVMQFRSKPAVETELRRIFQISEDQIRSMIVRRDEDSDAVPVQNGMPVRQFAPAPQAAPVQTAPVQAAPATAPAPATEAPVVEAAPVVETPPAEEPTVVAPTQEASEPGEASA